MFFSIFFPLAAILLTASLVALARRILQLPGRHLPLPPGPRARWFGTVKLPKEYQWLTYARWKDVYGDLIYVRVLGNPILVLNTAEAVTDLFEKRSARYSSRPTRSMVTELMGWDWLFSTMPYGPTWRKHRACFQQHFNVNALGGFKPIILREAHTLLHNLIMDDSALFHHVRRSAAAIVMMLSYGHQIAPEGDLYVTIADKALAGLAQAGIFGTYLVDYLSCLKYIPAWFPGAAFQRQAFEWRHMNRMMRDLPFEKVKREMTAGKAVPCFVTEQLDRLFTAASKAASEPALEGEDLVKNVAAIAYAAGADTTVSAILSFFLAVQVWPEVQTKAQRQIDAVVGPDRLPSFDDREDLPAIDCIVWECLRWNPVTPLGLARHVGEDDEYRGYRIPKGTTIVPNVWAILHDEKMYPEPLRFNPDRFADEEQNAALGINDLPNAAFGFGRRMCPGRALAFETIWITIVTTLAVFNISKAKDEHGNIIEPDIQFTPTLLSHPRPFCCVIALRSEKARSLVMQTLDR
ncbi:cytochrome P450 [Phanerochaete sordida]|uniref:Cytochrome P450 n=1 Tax=Phanerochaete sordida TaxID=48140 RepID=A0A9P3G4W6_9APHY|nr:cytochrome P450 [Phanerochaete sordida]